MALPVYHAFPYEENNRLLVCMYGKVWPRPKGCSEIWVFMDVSGQKPTKQFNECYKDTNQFFKGNLDLRVSPIDNLRQWLIDLRPAYICCRCNRQSEVYRQLTLHINKEIYGD